MKFCGIIGEVLEKIVAFLCFGLFSVCVLPLKRTRRHDDLGKY